MIPKKVKEFAEKTDFNAIYKIDENVYTFGKVDENGVSLPIGLPMVAIYENDDVRIIRGMEAFKFLSVYYPTW